MTKDTTPRFSQRHACPRCLEYTLAWKPDGLVCVRCGVECCRRCGMPRPCICQQLPENWSHYTVDPFPDRAIRLTPKEEFNTGLIATLAIAAVYVAASYLPWNADDTRLLGERIWIGLTCVQLAFFGVGPYFLFHGLYRMWKAAK